MGQISKKGMYTPLVIEVFISVYSVFQNNLRIVTIQWSLLISGVAMVLVGLGIVAFRNGTFKLKRNFTSMHPGEP